MNFKEFKRVYIETCNKIIEEKGKCVNIECKDCPFSCNNQINELDCVSNKYNDGSSIDCEQITLLNSAKEYLKLIKGENDMTKQDLKDGMVVELRNREKRLVLNNNLLNHDYYINLELYKDDLRFTSSSYDVMKVYTSESSCLNNILNVKHYNLIWERKEKSEAEIKLDNIEKQIEELQKSAKELRGVINNG